MRRAIYIAAALLLGAAPVSAFSPVETAWRMTSALNESWVYESWQNSTLTTYSYDDDLLSETLYQSWSSTGSWINMYRFTYSYDTEERNTLILTESWIDGSWQSEYLQTFTYDGDDPVQELVEIWSGEGWVNSSLTTFAYQSGRLHQEIFQVWGAADAWVNSIRKTYTCQGDLLSRVLEQTWITDSWVNNVLETYSYSGEDLDQVLVRDWFELSWQNSTLRDYTVSGGLLTELLFRNWLHGMWVDYFHYDYSYDGFGNNTQTIAQACYGGTWNNASRSTFEWESCQGIGGSGSDTGPRLGEPAPNPSRGSVSAILTLSGTREVRITVHDLRGGLISIIADGLLPSGDHVITWSGEAPAGVYLLRVETREGASVRRIILLD